MHPLSSIVVFVAFVAVCGYANGSVVQPSHGLDVASDDGKIPNKETAEAPAQLNVDAPGKPVAEITKECVPIGQFCYNHSDCCSNSCLGYMKRCVSGSG